MINTVLIPLIKSELNQLLIWLKACPNPGSGYLSIYLSIDSAWSLDEKKLILTTFNKSKFKENSTVYFIDCNIPPTHSFYIRDKTISFNIDEFPYGKKSGPNIQFFKSFNHILNSNSRVNSILLLETDAYPLKNNWLSELNYRTEWLTDNVYIAGSHNKGSASAPSIRNHLNGNAIYFTHKNNFDVFLNAWEKLLLDALKHNPDIAYDVVLDWCHNISEFNPYIKDILDNKNSYISDIYKSKLVDISDIIHNLSDVTGRFYSVHEFESFITSNPNIIIVHGKCMNDSTDIIREYFTNESRKATIHL